MVEVFGLYDKACAIPAEAHKHDATAGYSDLKSGPPTCERQPRTLARFPQVSAGHEDPIYLRGSLQAHAGSRFVSASTARSHPTKANHFTIAIRQFHAEPSVTYSAEVATIVSLNQSIVWIDEIEARILRVDEGLYHKATIQASETPAQSSVRDTGTDDVGAFFHRVARALDWADEILIVGPSTTKVEFLKYMHKNDHSIDPRILGVESIGHPSDKELRGFADLYFSVGGPLRAGNGGKRKGS